MLQKIHDTRIGVQYRQSVRVGHSDGPQIQPFGEEAVTVQDGSLPVPVARL
jgi:hypothetical protein